MTAPATDTFVDIKVSTPLPFSVVLTLGALLDAAYPGTELATSDEPNRNQIVFRVNNSKPPTFDDADAAELKVEPADDDLEILGLCPEGLRTLTPEVIASNFLPVLKAAFEQNPDAANYLEFPLTDPEDSQRYLLTFCRSADQTPHDLKMKSEDELPKAAEKSIASTLRCSMGSSASNDSGTPTPMRRESKLPSTQSGNLASRTTMTHRTAAADARTRR